MSDDVAAEMVPEHACPRCKGAVYLDNGQRWVHVANRGATCPPERAVPVLYLDLDGTVRQGKDDDLGRFVNGAEDVVVFPEAIVMMQRWRDGGGRVVGVSNQGGIALGIVSFDAVAAAMVETQRQTGNLFDRIVFCQHHPNAEHPEMARCWCRKPSAGAVVEAAHGLVERFPGEIYPPYMGLFVGDRDEDQACAHQAGVDFQWAADWRNLASSES